MGTTLVILSIFVIGSILYIPCLRQNPKIIMGCDTKVV